MHERNNLTKAAARLLIALFVLSCVSRAHPQRHHAHEPHSPVISAVPFGSDTHHKANLVTLESNGFDKTISIKFGSRPSKELSFTTLSDDAGNLVATDIDRDGDVDLIWVGSTDRNHAVVWINGGQGNFAEASDNTPYSSELDELFNTSDFPGKRSVKKHRKSSSLVSPHFSDIGLAAETLFHAPTIQKHFVATAERVADRLAIITHVRERGPPSIPS
ncbi:MAG TPA: VCBS repeat-containing protein [Pyrinomonadaceae bacterium]|nr:VCBS repeat-containing protein [Pyrinomonadaceae bacterium]